MGPTLFLSHAAADQALATAFQRMLHAIGLGPNDIFFTSGAGTGVDAGASFPEYIRAKMEGATFVVALISPAYRRSEFCLAELGAVWFTANKQFYPLAVSPVLKSEMEATLTGVHIGELDEESLADLLHTLTDHFGLTYSAAAATRAQRDFLDQLPVLLEQSAAATRAQAGPPRPPMLRLTEVDGVLGHVATRMSGHVTA